MAGAVDSTQRISRRPLAQSVKTIYTAIRRLMKRRFFCTRCTPGMLARSGLRNGTEPGHHRDQPDRLSQRHSPRRLACVRVRRPAADARAARRAVARAPRVRGSLPSGRPPRLNDAPGRSLNSRGPDSAKDPGLFVFFFHFGCAPALRRRIDAWRTRRGMCAAGNPHRAARRRLRREGSRGGTAEVEVTQVVFVRGQDTGFSIRVRRFKAGHATPSI